MAHGVTPEGLAEALDACPGAQAAFVVSPTYYGLAADVAGLAEVAHARGVPLVVDQSWGPHFGFHEAVPESALRLGADAALTSTHKIVGSLTQSAMLHVAAGGRVDPEAVGRAVRLVKTTSPSAAADGLARRRPPPARRSRPGAAARGHWRPPPRCASAIDVVPGCAVVGEDMVGRAGVAAWDPLRVVIDVRGTGRTGYEVYAAVRESYDAQLELATHATVVLVLGIAQPVDDLERFAYDFAETIGRISRPGEAQALARSQRALHNEVAMTPRDAFLGRTEVVAIADAEGRVSSESIAGYPPGIPALLPGERVTREAIEYLRELVSAGARLHGAADPDLDSMYVVCE